MALKSDQSGFLIADSGVDAGKLAAGIGGVRADTSAILALLKTGAKNSVLNRQKVSNPNSTRPNAGQSRATAGPSRSVSSVSAPSRERDARGRFVSQPQSELTGVAKAVNSMTRQQATAKSAQDRADAASERTIKPGNPNQTRDTRGRFGSGGSRGSGGGASQDSDGTGLLSKFKGLFSKWKTPDIGAGDFDKVDPTIEAGKEFSKLIGGPLAAAGSIGKSVIGRGFSGGKDGAVPWYRKILTELKLTRAQAGEFGLTETRVLKDIEHKTGGGSVGGGGKGLFGSLAGGLGDMLGKGGGGLMSLLGKGGKGLLGLGKLGLKRLPLLGALFAGGSALASAFGPDDPTKSKEENRHDRFTGVGSGVGALIGGGLGMLLGPVGAMVGGVLGDKVGELVGEWLSTLDWTEIGKSITGAWDSTVGFFKDSWKTVTDKLAEITKTVSETWTSIISGVKAFVKDHFGLDIDAITAKAADVAKPAVEAVKNTVGPAIDKAKEVGGAVLDYGKDRVKKMAEPIGRATDRAGTAIQEFGGSLLENVSPGYRHKASFDGIKGGDSLTKNGSYTDSESERIRQLKTGGDNTSANLKGGMPKEIQEKIIAQALASGLDPAMMLKMASMESGGNANAISSTGAIGIYQFTGKTGSGVGIKDRFNADENIAGGMKLTQANMAVLKAAKLPVTAENLYMMHQLGPSAAKELIAGASTGKNISDLSSGTQKAVSLNYGSGSKTAAEYLGKNSDALTARADSVIGNSTTGYLPSVVASAAPNTILPSPVVATAAVRPAGPMPSASIPPPPVAPPTATAAIPAKMNADAPIDVRVSQDQTVGQDLSDRRLAHIATGGIAA